MGSSGGDGGMAKRQAKMKAEQDAAIRRVNTVFGSHRGVINDRNAAERDKLYGTIQTDAESRLMSQLGEDRGDAERQVRFQLARQGLAGGSADIDQGAEILRQFQEGSLEARNAAVGTANQARSADEQTRVNLINNIRNGMAESDAVSSAYSGMRNNANEARDNAMTTQIGNFFNDLALIRNQQQFQQGMQQGQQFGRSGTIYGSGSSGGNNGRVIGG